MNRVPAPIQEEELHAYIDGWLARERREEVEQYLREHPDVAVRIETAIAQRNDLQRLYAPLAQAPIPPALNLQRLAMQDRAGWRFPWAMAAAILLSLALGGAGGWQMARQNTPDMRVALVDEAAMNYHVYASYPADAVEMPATDTSRLQQWLSQRLARPVMLPDLQGANYRLMGARVVATRQGAAAMLFYGDAQGMTMALLLRPVKPDANMPMMRHAIDHMAGYGWADAGMGYSLVAHDDDLALHDTANALRQDIRKHLQATG